MDEELKKRNTDCVYFLASPLTCKKGTECEYRHSEIARLNPRDCWYWLAGSCFNPSCAFRHPPLDVRTEVSSESAPPQYQSSEPVNKVNYPCHFYFNGFCNKGDRCSFLHGPNEDGMPPSKSLSTASAVNSAPPSENKTSAGLDTGSAQIEAQPNPSEVAPKRAAEIQSKVKEDVHLSALNLNNVKDRSATPHTSASECGEAAAVRSDTSLPEKGLIHSRSFVCTDQSSDEQVDGYIEREDWLESSPGFDVLVDDMSENLGYEDDPEYALAIDKDGGELNGHFLGYDYEDPVEYDTAYPDVGYLYEQEGHDSYDQFDNEQRLDYVRKVHRHSSENMLDPILPQKRTFLPMDLVIHGQRGVDLRDHLKKRRVIDGHSVTRFSRRNNSSLLVDQRRERSRLHGARRLRGRLTTDNNSVGSLRKNGNMLNDTNPPGWFRQSHSNRPSQRYMEKRQSKRQFLSSEVSRRSVSRETRAAEESIFNGPKTLAQIKEEKRKAVENGNSRRTTPEEFQGPKPLSEILKTKRRWVA